MIPDKLVFEAAEKFMWLSGDIYFFGGLSEANGAESIQSEEDVQPDAAIAKSYKLEDLP